MPPLPPVPNVLVMSWKFVYGTDKDVVVRAHYRYTGTVPGPTNIAGWCAAAVGDFSGANLTIFSSAVELILVSAADLTSPTAGVGSAAASAVGTRAGAPLDANTAVLINHHIGRRYRGGKPRTYLPAGVGADLATPQSWTAGALSNFTLWPSYLEQVRQGMPGTTVLHNLVNVSYYKGSQASITGTAPYERGHTKPIVSTDPGYPIVDDITSSSVNPKPASQRRRAGFST